MKGGGIHHYHGADNCPECLVASRRPFSLTPAYSSTWPFTMPQTAPVQFGGNSNINLTGNIYAPNAAVTFQGNPTIT